MLSQHKALFVFLLLFCFFLLVSPRSKPFDTPFEPAGSGCLLPGRRRRSQRSCPWRGARFEGFAGPEMPAPWRTPSISVFFLGGNLGHCIRNIWHLQLGICNLAFGMAFGMAFASMWHFYPWPGLGVAQNETGGAKRRSWSMFPLTDRATHFGIPCF